VQSSEWEAKNSELRTYNSELAQAADMRQDEQSISSHWAHA